MTETALRDAKRPATPLAGPYGHPFHAMLVTIPIGTWIAAVVFDIVGLVGDDPAAFVTGARWLFGIGILGALLAGVVGFLDFTRLRPGTKARGFATVHMVLNLSAVAIFTLAWLLHLGADEVPVLGFVLALVGIAGVSVSGFLGGELAYRFGVRVADESDQAKGFVGASGR